MKTNRVFTSLTLASLFLATAILPARAVTISQWTFDPPNAPAVLNNSITSPNVAASTGLGTASGRHASAATDWTAPVGNGSANSISANTWAVGDYWQFQISTVGFADISLRWDQASSGTGPRDFGLFWSVTGLDGSFAQFGANYAVFDLSGSPNPAWSAGTPQPAYGFTQDLSSIAALDNDSSIFFRLVLQGTTQADGAGTVLSGGTDRIDNFTVSGTAVPTAVPDSLPWPVSAATFLAIVALAHRFSGRRCVS